jgi:hypothetical protein
MEALQQHQQLCDELHELALEENRFLQQNRRAPDAPLLDRKRALLARLDDALNALRSVPRDGGADIALKQALEKTRTRVLQILQLDRENEQLLLRYSLAGGPAIRSVSTPAAAPSMLQKIYQRHS